MAESDFADPKSREETDSDKILVGQESQDSNDNKIVNVSPDVSKEKDREEDRKEEPQQRNEPRDALADKSRTNRIETHVDRAETVYNIQAETVIAEGPETDTAELDDLLKDLKGRPPFIRHAGFNYEGRGWGRCNNHAIVFLTSFDYVAALDVAYEVIKHNFAKCDPYYLDLSERDDVSVHALSEAQNTSKRQRIILVELAGRTNFLDSIKQATVTKTFDLVTWLEEQDTTVLCVTSDRIFEQAEVPLAKSMPAFQHCKIPFLEYVLEDVFGPSSSTEMEEKIRIQRSEGRWPRKDDEFLKWLKDFWEKEMRGIRITDCVSDFDRTAGVKAVTQMFPHGKGGLV